MRPIPVLVAIVIGTFSITVANTALAAPQKQFFQKISKGKKQAMMRVQTSHSSFGESALVANARRFIGTNPTGRRSVWCGAFMDKILRDTGHRGGGNLARGYLNYGPRISGPQVGAIAVMHRASGRGEHVGLVSGVDANGNPVVISGNTWGGGSSRHRVMEQSIPRGRIIAYVMPKN